MKHSPFNNLKIYRYFFIAFILILGILAIYVSCKSKSPTDAHVPFNDALAAQGAKTTTQTTTSSSTTTSIKPGQLPTNTTTLITSRTLTSTSTRTTTTSSSTTSTTTTSRKSTTTTSAGVCNLEWCQVTLTINDGTPITFQQYGGTYTLHPGDQVKISISIKNSGTANSIGAYAILPYIGSPPTSFSPPDYNEYLGTIPANNVCYTWSDALQINVTESASPGDNCTVEIRIGSNNCSMISSTFGIYIGT